MEDGRKAILYQLHWDFLKATNERREKIPTPLTETQGTREWIKERQLRIMVSEVKSFANANKNIQLIN